MKEFGYKVLMIKQTPGCAKLEQWASKKEDFDKKVLRWTMAEDITVVDFNEDGEEVNKTHTLIWLGRDGVLLKELKLQLELNEDEDLQVQDTAQELRPKMIKDTEAAKQTDSVGAKSFKDKGYQKNRKWQKITKGKKEGQKVLLMDAIYQRKKEELGLEEI